MRRSWKTIAFVAVAAIGGVMAGRALAGDDTGGMHETQKAIDGLALVKALSGKWNVKTAGDFGDGEAVATFRVGVGKTVLLEEYDSKGKMGEYNGFGLFKFADDGKTGSVWWIDSMAKEPAEYKGTVTDTGYEFTHGDGAEKVTLKMTKKGEGFEWTLSSAMGSMTGAYTKAK